MTMRDAQRLRDMDRIGESKMMDRLKAGVRAAAVGSAVMAGSPAHGQEMTPQEIHQSHLDHIAARGDAAMADKRLGIGDSPASPQEQDIDNYADVFGSREMGDQHRAINAMDPAELRRRYVFDESRRRRY